MVPREGMVLEITYQGYKTHFVKVSSQKTQVDIALRRRWIRTKGKNDK